MTDRDGQQSNTITEKEAMLRRESFPPNEHDQYFKLPLAGQVHHSLTEEAVERAIFAQVVGKAPGPDTLCFGPLNLRLEWEKSRIIELPRAVVRTSRLPAVWKRPSGVVNRKPGKHNYTKLNAYRSISVLSCMGKVFKKVFAELMAEDAERRELVSDTQFGSRKRRSAVDAAAIMVDSTNAARREGHIAAVLLMDIQAAFPNLRRVETDPHNERQGQGWRPDSSDGKFSLRQHGRNGNGGQCDGETLGGSRYTTGLTGGSYPVRNLQIRSHKMGGGESCRSRRPIVHGQRLMGGDRERRQPRRQQTLSLHQRAQR